MKKIILLFGLIAILLLAGCNTNEIPQNQTNIQPTCNKPYILVGTSCCLDKNDNSICDSDEVKEEPKIEVKKEKEPESKPQIEEKPKEYSIQQLKDDIDDVYDKVHIWEVEIDKLDPDVVYYVYTDVFDDEVIIAEIKNKDKYLKDYNDFLNFNFNYGYNESFEKEWKNKIFKSKNITEDNLDLTIGKVNEKKGYWEEDLNTKWVHHSFNIYCAPNLYVKLKPNWAKGFGNMFLGLNNDNVINAFNQFNSEAKKMLPKISKVLKECLLTQTNEIYDLEQKINAKLNANYVLLKKEDTPKLIRYYSFGEEELMIEEIKDKDMFLDNNKFKEYVINQFDDSMKKLNIEGFEEDMKQDFSEQKGSGRGIYLVYYRYVNHTLDKNILFNNITILTEISPNLVETKFASYDKYNISYRRGESITGLSSTEYTETKQKIKVNVMQKMSILCKPNIVIDLFSYDFDYNLYEGVHDEQTNLANVRNQVKKNRKELLTKATKILRVCS